MREINPAVYGDNMIVLQWYAWVAFAALVVALLGAFWIFYDSHRKRTEPLTWKVLIVVSVVFLVPSVAVGVDERIAQNVNQAVPLLAYLGIIAAAGSVVAILAYLGKLGYPVEVEEYFPGPVPARGNTPPPFPSPNLSTGSVPSLSAGPIPTEAIGTLGSVGQPAVSSPRGAPVIAKTELLNVAPDEIAFLVVRSGPRSGKEYRLSEVTTLGRDGQQCDIVLEDGSASGQHARIKLEQGKFVLYDLASTNGTKVNNIPVDKQALQDGDQVRIGKTDLVFMQIKSGK